MDPDSFSPVEPLDDNTENIDQFIFPYPEEHLELFAFDFQEDLSFFTEEIPQTECIHNGPPAVLESATVAPPPSNSVNDGRAQPQPTELEWENHKATIIDLFWEKTNKNLVRIMKDRHGFYASEKQYRNRLRKWGFRKNYTTDEMLKMFQIWQRRKAQGKETEFLVRKRPVPRRKIVRFKKRKSITTSTNTSNLGPTPDYMEYYTPTGSDSRSTSGRQSRPQGSSPASQDDIRVSMVPLGTSAFDYYMRNRATNSTTARTRQSTTQDESRVQLDLSPGDMADLWMLRAPVPGTELRRSIETMDQIPEAERAEGINVGSRCRYCGFLGDSPAAWGQNMAAIVTSIQPNLYMTDPLLNAFLGLAIKHNEDTVLRHLIRRCQQPKFSQRMNRHLLCMALDHGRGDLFHQLLLHGLDVDAEGKARKGLLMQARSTLRQFITARVEQDNGVGGVAEAMGLMYRAHVMTKKLWKDTVLWTALRHQRADVLRTCLAPPTSAVLDIDGLMDKSAKMRQIIEYTRSPQAAAELVAAAAGVVSKNGATALHLATSLLLRDEVLRLLDAGVDVNDTTETGETALHILAGLSCSDGAEVARILLDRNADVAAADSVGDGALHHAAQHPWTSWRARFAQLLLQAGASVNARNHRGETPCITAALCQDMTAARDIVHWFLDSGAREDARDCDGNTAQRHLEQRERERETRLECLSWCGTWVGQDAAAPWTAENQESMHAELLRRQLWLYDA